MRIQLSGPNDQIATRTVYCDDVAVGEVRPINRGTHIAWEAIDNAGRNHGDQWIKDWYAAQGLVNGLGLGKVKS